MQEVLVVLREHREGIRKCTTTFDWTTSSSSYRHHRLTLMHPLWHHHHTRSRCSTRRTTRCSRESHSHRTRYTSHWHCCSTTISHHLNLLSHALVFLLLELHHRVNRVRRMHGSTSKGRCSTAILVGLLTRHCGVWLDVHLTSTHPESVLLILLVVLLCPVVESFDVLQTFHEFRICSSGFHVILFNYWDVSHFIVRVSWDVIPYAAYLVSKQVYKSRNVIFYKHIKSIKFIYISCLFAWFWLIEDLRAIPSMFVRSALSLLGSLLTLSA